MSHTPGPWIAVENGIDSYLIQSEDYGGIAMLHDPYAVEQGRLPQLEASAHLIAAAPDLLEALEGFFEPAHLEGCLWLDDRRMPCQCGSRERVAERERAARAAISKARGAA